MRNIYDIITEQKAIVDVNMASYDLDYTVSHFMNNQDNYYVQEGLGEGLKNAGKAIVEFIKKVIEKIKELVRKFINFFTSSNNGKSLEKELNEKIEKANEKKKDKDESKEDKEEAPKQTDKPKQKEEKKPEKPEEPKKGAHSNVNDLHHLLTSSFTQVTCKSFGALSQRLDFVKKFSSKYNVMLLEGLDEIQRNKKAPNFKGQIMDKLLFADEDDELIPEMKSHFLDMDQETTFKVFQKGEKIYEYIVGANDTVKVFKQAEDSIVKHLNDLINTLNRTPSANNNMAATYIQNACATVSTIMNYMVQSTMRAYQISAKIARQVTGEYAEVRNVGFKYEEN